MPQCEDGYTRIANELLDALCKIRVPGESMQIFLAILRKTYGYGKKTDRIALSQLAEMTGIVKTHISRSLEKLIEIGIVTKEGNGTYVTYGINKHYAKWTPLPKKVTVTQKGNKVTIIGNEVTKEGNEKLPIKVNTKEKKEILQKKLSKEKVMFEICIAWKAFIEMRKAIKKPMTQYAMKLRVNDLIRLQSKGNDPVAVLNQSTSSCWQDLYPLKEGKKEPKRGLSDDFEKTLLGTDEET
jgi:phage replication O-like protein O